MKVAPAIWGGTTKGRFIVPQEIAISRSTTAQPSIAAFCQSLLPAHLEFIRGELAGVEFIVSEPFFYSVALQLKRPKKILRVGIGPLVENRAIGAARKRTLVHKPRCA